MKTKPNQAMRELRKVIGQTQGELAAMIGASKDAVASWELGRNKLSAQFARRIAFASGVDEAVMRRARGPLTGYVPGRGRLPYTRELFDRYRTTYWGRSEEGAARQHLRNCVDALSLVFLAAAKPKGKKIRYRLPGVIDSFVQWCERARRDFQLEDQIEEQLLQRSAKISLNHTYRQWRTMQKEDPWAARSMGFKDNPRKGDKENLRLEVDTFPIWRPGYPMRGPR